MDIHNFEKELLSKLQFKASSRLGVDTVLLKIFKFFDLTNEGSLRKQDFLRAIAKAGVTLADQEFADRLWAHYSSNEIINYRDFIQKVVGVPDGLEGVNPADSRIQNAPPTLDTLRAKIQLRGALGLLALANALPQQFTCQLLHDQLRRQGIDVENPYQLFSGEYMSLQNLLSLLKGSYLSPFRQALLSNVFSQFEQPVSPHYLIERYRAERHPEIKILQRTPQEIKEEFAQALGMYIQLRGIKSLTVADFFDFYSYVGFYIQNDEIFRSLINEVWDAEQQGQQASPPSVKQKLNFSPAQPQQPKAYQNNYQPVTFSPESAKQGPPSVHSRQSVPKSAKSHQSQLSATSKQVELIVQRIRNRLISRGARGFISLYRVGRILDADHDGMLNLSEFRRAIRDHRIEVTDPEIDLVFQYFDREASGLIDLWGFMFVLRGEMPQLRIQLVEQLFEKFRTEDHVQIGTLKANFNVRNHPDLRSGKKSDDEIIADFFEPLVQLHHINGGFGNENISKDELLEYFSNFSAAIPEDKYFEQILISVFKIGSEAPKFHHAGNKQVFEPDHKRSYLQDHHRYLVQGGSVSQNAPFGTFNQVQEQPSQRPSTAYVQPSSFNIFKPLEQDQKSQKQQPLGDSQISQQSRPQDPVEQTPKLTSKRSDPIQVLKHKILQRGLRGIIGIQARFQLYDKANLGALSYQEWIACFRQWRLEVPEALLQEVFNQFQSNGMMIYDSFIKQIQGTMSIRKFNLVQQAFDSLPKQTIEVAKNSFNAKDHPDVRLNRRREDDVLCEFIDTFEQHHHVFTGNDYIKNPNIVFEEFISYYNNISALIEDESLFEQQIAGVWNLRKRL